MSPLKSPNDTTSIYQLGSITKTFTGAAILQLQEEKKLSIKDKLSRYLPDYPNVIRLPSSSYLPIRPGSMTTKACFIHRTAWNLPGPSRKNVYFPHSKTNRWPTNRGRPVNYSNSGYFLLGLIIEKVTQQPFETVIRERFIKPLQLTRTGFDFINRQTPDKTTGYTYWKDSVLVAVRPLDSTAAYAAGGMYSSVGDLYRWTQAFRSTQLLKSVSQRLAFTPIKPGNWSCGWGINDFANHKKLVFQNGNLPGFATFLVLIPDDDTVLIMLANVDDTSDMTTLEPMLKDLLFVTYGMPYQLPISFKTVQVSEAILQQYVGQYQLDPKRIITITLDQNRLFLQVTGQERFEIFPSSETDFFLKAVNAQLTFQKDETGRVTQITVHQNGDIGAKRL